jgi:hypothetical protein
MTHSGQELPGTVSEQIFNLVKEWGHCDVLLDRELSDPFCDEIAGLKSEELVATINPKVAALPEDECLILARLSQAQLPFIDKTIAIGQRENTGPSQVRPVGGWLFSQNTTLPQLAQRIEKAIIVRIGRADSALLRAWDPRVIGHLERILTPVQIAALLGPITCWAWIDRGGALRKIIKPDFATAEKLAVPLPLVLSPEQDAAVDRIEEINRLLRTLGTLDHTIPAGRDAELDALLVRAIAKGHASQQDMLVYCLHALLVHAAFDELPDVKRAIAQTRASGGDLCAALEQFDDAYWEAHTTSSAMI